MAGYGMYMVCFFGHHILYGLSHSLRSPGFALSLVAESTTGALLSAERAAEKGETPEDIGRIAAKTLLAEVQRGGCVDSANQWLNLLFMVLGPEDVSKMKFGRLTAFS